MNMKTHIFHFLRAICLGGLLSASAFCAQAENIVYVPTPGLEERHFNYESLKTRQYEI